MITVVFSSLLVALGVAIIVRTLTFGVGGGLGILLGVLFILAGGARLYLHRQTNGRSFR
jgi:hypothetical protein